MGGMRRAGRWRSEEVVDVFQHLAGLRNVGSVGHRDEHRCPCPSQRSDGGRFNDVGVSGRPGLSQQRRAGKGRRLV